jgi:hypothetical protein
MPSIINASSSGSGGLVQTADASGVLQLQNNGSTTVTVDGGNTYINCTSSPISTVGTGRLNINGSQGVYVSGYGDALGFGSVFKQSASAAGNLGWPVFFVNSSESNIGGIRQGASSVEYRSANGAAGAILLNSGVYFPASQVASADPNTLDDYEEGSWTPQLSNNGFTGSWSIRAGRYVKIGNQVTCWANFDGGSSGGGTGALLLSGLPFSQESSGGTWQNTGIFQASSAPNQGSITMQAAGGTTAQLWVGGGQKGETVSFASMMFTYRVA